MDYRANTYIALVDRLTNYADLAALLPTYQGAPAIFDHVPQDFKNAFPYVVIQNMEINQLDDDTNFGYDALITIHTWSDSRDITDLSNVMGAIKKALHYYKLQITNYSVSAIFQELETVLRDPDEITRHGVQQFRLYFEDLLEYTCN